MAEKRDKADTISFIGASLYKANCIITGNSLKCWIYKNEVRRDE